MHSQGRLVARGAVHSYPKTCGGDVFEGLSGEVVQPVEAVSHLFEIALLGTMGQDATGHSDLRSLAGSEVSSLCLG
jgi:hypothetical protein